MDARDETIWQARDLLRCIFAGICSLIFFFGGIWKMIEGDLKVGSAGIAAALVVSGIAWISFARLRRSIRAEEKFALEHRGKLDWKGDVLEESNQNRNA